MNNVTLQICSFYSATLKLVFSFASLEFEPLLLNNTTSGAFITLGSLEFLLYLYTTMNILYFSLVIASKLAQYVLFTISAIAAIYFLPTIWTLRVIRAT